MKKSLIEITAHYLGFSSKEVVELSKKAPRSYFRFEIPKKNGGKRAIFHPSKETKSLQYALIETLLKDFDVHKSAMAYIPEKKSPLKVNALIHCPYMYSVRVDFKDFFPSIRPRDLISIIEENCGTLSVAENEFLSDSLFANFKAGVKGLAIGAPSSPVICNIVMSKLDVEISRIAAQVSANSAYTRYADDIVYSTNDKNMCSVFANQLTRLLQNTQSPKLSVNIRKTVYLSKKSKRMVTGVVLGSDGEISLGRGNKRFIRKLIFDFKNQNISLELRKYLRGYLGFSLDIEPDFFNRLAIKYGADLLRKIMEN